MKQKYVLLISIIIFAVLLCGCNFGKPSADICIWPNDSTWNDTSTPSQANEQQLWVSSNLSIDNLKPVVRDIFTAKIVERVGEIDDSDFSDIRNSYAIPILYHVEIQKIISTQVVTEKETIKVVNYEENDENTDYFANSLEIGGTYLFGGMAQPVGNSVVLVDSGAVLSEINSDDFTLTPMCSLSQKNMNGLDTLTDFTSSSGIINFKDSLATLSFPTAISSNYVVKKDGKDITLNTSSLSADDYNYYLSTIKDAVKVGSTAQLTKVDDSTAVETK